jgi:hypothetical protein
VGTSATGTAYLFNVKSKPRYPVQQYPSLYVKITDVWDVTPCSLVDRYGRFGETYCIHQSHNLGMNERIFIGSHWPTKSSSVRCMGLFTSIHTYNKGTDENMKE